MCSRATAATTSSSLPIREWVDSHPGFCVRILPPYRPSAAEIADPSLYAANVRRLVADALSLPVVDQGYEEFAALLRAGVRVDAAGARVVAPPGVVGGDGFADLTEAGRRREKKVA